MREKKAMTETDALGKIARLLEAQPLDAQKRIITYVYSRIHDGDTPAKAAAKLSAVS